MDLRVSRLIVTLIQGSQNVYIDSNIEPGSQGVYLDSNIDTGILGCLDR